MLFSARQDHFDENLGLTWFKDAKFDGTIQIWFGGLQGCKAGLVDFQEHWSGGVNFYTARKQKQNIALKVEWQLIQESSTVQFQKKGA